MAGSKDVSSCVSVTPSRAGIVLWREITCLGVSEVRRQSNSCVARQGAGNFIGPGQFQVPKPQLPLSLPSNSTSDARQPIQVY